MPRTILVDNVEYSGEALTDDEQRIFDTHFDKLLAPGVTHLELLYPDIREVVQPVVGMLSSEAIGVTRGELDRAPSQEKQVKIPYGYVSALFKERREHVLYATMIAKKAFIGVFKGIDGRGEEIVFQHIKPWHILRDQTAAETPATGWDRWQANPGDPWAAGADNWLGFGANNGTAVNIDSRAMVVILGYAELGFNRPVQGVRLQVDQILYQPTVFHPFLSLSPNDGRVPVVPAKTQVCAHNAQVVGTVYTDAAVNSVLMALGVTIGKASYMINNYLATVTL